MQVCRPVHSLQSMHPLLNFGGMPMKVTSRSGAAIAAAAATLFLAGATMSTVAYAAGEGKCVGANACKGQSACKGGASACKGQNACKGQGFSEVTKEKCAAAKGKFTPS
jgi:hypothetical protein